MRIVNFCKISHMFSMDRCGKFFVVVLAEHVCRLLMRKYKRMHVDSVR